MNRDWFARTQPETDGKLDVVREYPPTLFIDAHEFGLADYFFPPNADPEYHEIPDQAHEWINGLYSPAIVSQFNNEGIKFFHGAPYDFFAIVFGDTVPATAYGAAGMTFEKESGDPISEREHEHFTSMWASLAAGAAARDAVVTGWRASWEEAAQEGDAGTLEPNAVFELLAGEAVFAERREDVQLDGAQQGLGRPEAHPDLKNVIRRERSRRLACGGVGADRLH